MKKPAYFIIFLLVLLLIASIVIFNVSLVVSQEEPDLDVEILGNTPSIPTEEGVFKRSEFSTKYAEMPEDPENQRTLDEYYENRAYYGAPPIIPHPLISEKGIGGSTCLQCHENGGYVNQFEAYAPVTPHPELLNCRQCHVSVNADRAFVESEFEKGDKPEIQNSAMPGSPPVIPHTLVMRANCLSCHAGPAAPKEIRVSHPLRINCRQCHVPVTDLSSLHNRGGFKQNELQWEQSDEEDIEKIKDHINE